MSKPFFRYKNLGIKTINVLILFSFIFAPLGPVFAQDAETPSAPQETSGELTGQVDTPTASEPVPTDIQDSISSMFEDMVGDITDVSSESTQSATEETVSEESLSDLPEDDNQPQSLLSGGDESPTTQAPNLFSYQSIKPQVDHSSGALTQKISLEIPPGRRGLQPDVSLKYNSQQLQDDSIVGYGWSVSIPYIERMNKRGTNNLYTDSYFYSSVSGELATTSATTSPNEYYARVDDGSHIQYLLSTSTNNSWIAYDKNGTKYTYGAASSTQQYDSSGDTTKVYRWMLQEVRDTNDNYITYTYTRDVNQLYPDTITYTGNGATAGVMTVSFTLASSTVPYTTYKSAFKISTNKQVSRIEAAVNGTWVRRYDLTYGVGANGFRPLLTYIQQSGRDSLGAEITLPPTGFSYASSTVGWTYSNGFGYPLGGQAHIATPTTDDGLNDQVLFRYDVSSNKQGYISGNYIGTVPEVWADSSLNALPIEEGTRFLDINADGASDLVRGLSKNGGNINTIYLNTSTSTGSYNSWYQIATSSIVGLVPYFARNEGGIMYTGGLLGNLNGDTLPDYTSSQLDLGNNTSYVGNGQGWFQTSNFTPVKGMYNGFGANAGYNSQLIDINGDGLDDWMWSDSSNTYFCINQGTSWDTGCTSPWTLATSTLYYNSARYFDRGMRFMDVNVDGLPDFIRAYNTPIIQPGNPGEQAVVYQLFLNTGSGWATSTVSSWGPAFTTTSQYGGIQSFSEMADWNGDGSPDAHQYPNQASKQDVLTKITYPKGGNTQITYKMTPEVASSTNPHLPTPMLVVTRLVTNDREGHDSQYDYTYTGGKLYLENGPIDRKFAGFSTITETGPLAVTKTYFNQGDVASTTIGERTDGYGQIGRAFREDVSSLTGTLLKQTFYQWDSTGLGNNRFLTVLGTQLARDFDASGANSKAHAVAYKYATSTGDLLETDDYGEVTASSDGTYTDTGSDTRVASSTYAQNLSINLSVPTATTQYVASTTRVKETRYTYDNLAFGSVTKGNLTKQEGWISGSTYASSTKGYNSYGLVASSSDPNGNQTTYSYDGYNLYPATVTNALSQATSYTYDYATGKVVQKTDPNTLVNKNIYDAVGRLIEVDVPDLTTPSTLVSKTTISYTDNTYPSYTATTNYLTSATSSTNYEYFDGLGRTIQTRTQAGGSNTYTVQDMVYDGKALVNKASLPYFASSTSRSSATSTLALYTNYTYDALGRTNTVVNSVGTTTNVYGAWSNSKTDPNGNTTQYVNDAWGNLINVIEPTPIVSDDFPSSGVLGYWKLDESSGDATDATGNGYTLTNQNSVSYTAGKLNNSSNFGSSNTNKRLDAYSALGRSYDSSITQSVWVNITTAPSTNGLQIITSQRVDGANPGTESSDWSLRYGDASGTKSIKWVFSGNSAQNILSFNQTLTPGVWYHMVGTYDSSTNLMSLYLNGSLVATATKTVAYGGSYGTGFTLGANFGGGLELSGKVDEVGAWNRALLGSEISVLYNDDLAKTYASSTPSPADAITAYVYDADNNLKKITDALGNLRNFTYDGLGRVLKNEDLHAPSATLFGSTTYAYDKVGNVTSKINPNGQTTTYTYDALNRIYNENYTGGTGTEGVYRYDSCTRGIGYICTASTTLSKITYTYNSLGLVATETHLIASPLQVKSYVTAYTYDRQGNITDITYPDGNSVKYGLDAMGRIQSINNKAPGASVFSPIINNTEYAPTGQVSMRAYANGLTSFYTVDPAAQYRLSNILTATSTDATITAIQNIGYTYDPVGNITSIYDVSSSASSKIAAFTYDELNRLVFASSTAYAPSSYVASSSLLNYLVVGGGGGGAGAGGSFTEQSGGGGGAQVNVGTTTIFTTGSYAVTVGARGTRGAAGENNGATGGMSVFGSFATSTGGVGGTYGTSGGAGGSGGTSGNGNTGGTGANGGAGGGGGASTIGQDGNGGTSVGGNGGTGVVSSISGTSITYGSGGGGGGYFTGGTGGSGGGAGGANAAGGGATANRGGGGGGGAKASGGSNVTGGHGGAGVVVVSYPVGALTATGGATSTSGGRMIHTFTTSGTFTISAVNSTTTLYAYPALYQTSYEYNSIGNITKKADAVDGSNVLYTYAGTNYANPHAPTSVASSTLTYDKDGNLTAYATSAYTWDWRDRMTRLVAGVGTTTYAYSTKNDRAFQSFVQQISTTTATTTTIYPSRLYSAATTTIGVGTTTISSSATSTDYIFAGDVLVATVERMSVNGAATGTPVTRYYYPDHLGSTNIVTDTAGTPVQTLDYYPYGATRLNVQVGGANANRQYIGQFTDPTNLSYLNARYYDGGRGQFLSQDPIFLSDPRRQNLMDPQTLNSYSYANNNPIINSDPSGKQYINYNGSYTQRVYGVPIGVTGGAYVTPNATYLYFGPTIQSTAGPSYSVTANPIGKVSEGGNFGVSLFSNNERGGQFDPSNPTAFPELGFGSKGFGVSYTYTVNGTKVINAIDNILGPMEYASTPPVPSNMSMVDNKPGTNLKSQSPAFSVQQPQATISQYRGSANAQAAINSVINNFRPTNQVQQNAINNLVSVFSK